MFTGVFQFNILWRQLDSDEVPQEKKSQQNPALLFLTCLLAGFLSSCIPTVCSSMQKAVIGLTSMQHCTGSLLDYTGVSIPVMFQFI